MMVQLSQGFRDHSIRTALYCITAGSFVWGDGEVTRRKSKAKALAPEDRSTDRGAGVLIQLNEEQVSAP